MTPFLISPTCVSFRNGLLLSHIRRLYLVHRVISCEVFESYLGNRSVVCSDVYCVLMESI